MNDRVIGDNIRLYVRIRNTTLHSLAAGIGVCYDTLSRWVNGHRPIPALGLYKISRVLGVSMEKLCEGADNESV